MKEAKTFVEDFTEKFPHIEKEKVIQGHCILDYYKPNETCEEQQKDCPECWAQRMEEK